MARNIGAHRASLREDTTSIKFNPGEWSATGACTMRCFPKLLLLLPGIVLLSCIEGLAQGPTYHIGRPATEDEVKALDIFIGPHGEGLPPGSGTVKQGQVIFIQGCAMCHGLNGEGGAKDAALEPAGYGGSDPYGDGPRLVGGIGTLADKHPVRTIG